ncbi:VCBS repeat-containing protein [bacterium]|nr:VCBS repeat-containing protein [bacterium]
MQNEKNVFGDSSFDSCSCIYCQLRGDSKNTDDTDTATDEPTDATDTADPTDSTDTALVNCGNRTIDAGEICDGNAMECNIIDSGYTGGIATCNADCLGWNVSDCQGNQTDPTNPTDPTDPTNPTDPTDPTNPGPTSDVEFERITVDDNPNKPAFVTVDDLDNDGNLDMIVAQYGPLLSGNYDIYWGTGKLDQWTKETLNIGGDNGISFPHPVKVADVNGDGIKDIVSPSGFLACVMNCGNIFWLEGTGTRNQWTKHEIVKNNDHFFFDLSLVDIDGDGIDDILTNASKKPTIGNPDEQLMWFKGTNTADRFETTARVISSGNGGPFPRFVDLNGDNKKDIALAQYFNKDTSANGSFLWFEQTYDIENWTKHVIDNESGESFMLEIIDDLYGDGIRRAVGVNHVNTSDTPNGPKEGVFIFDIPDDPTQPWTKKNIATDIKSRKSPMTGPQGAPGLFGYGDITGNGLIDLVVSGDGDSRVFWFEQNPAGTFTQHTLDGVAGASINSAGSFGQAGGMKIVDLDGDGKNEIIVTLYEDNKIYIYKYNK